MLEILLKGLKLTMKPSNLHHEPKLLTILNENEAEYRGLVRFFSPSFPRRYGKFRNR